ncbi:PAS domain-containing protein [Agrobacterium sp.]|jgi:PAS domain S-box-containing protein|uniref:PAS domain-containing protein n=1 Tax=Agrobacterium sp. TaxID=361 RepID=UPI0028AECEB0|nr:PAS domain-containing protein [Agrobacterium sp.]
MLGLFEAFSTKCLQLQQAVSAGHDELVRALDRELDPLIGIILSYKANNACEMHMQMQFLAALIREDADDPSSVVRHSAAMSMLIDRYFADTNAQPDAVFAAPAETKAKQAVYPDVLFSEVVLDMLPDRVVVVTPDCRFLYANKLYSKYVNKTQLSLIGNSVSELVGSEYFEMKIKPQLDRCFDGESLDYQEEHWGQGERVIVRYRMTPLRCAAHKIAGAVIVMEDAQKSA